MGWVRTWRNSVFSWHLRSSLNLSSRFVNVCTCALFGNVLRTDHRVFQILRADVSCSFHPYMPKKAQSSTPKQPSPDHIDSETLSIIDRLAQDEDGTILAGAQLIQATHKHLGIRTIYLRGPSNPRVMDRRIPVPTSPDDTENPGTCKYLFRCDSSTLLYHASKQTSNACNSTSQFRTSYKGLVLHLLSMFK